jgi:tRNA(fMet)-specific endonuclease VapC
MKYLLDTCTVSYFVRGESHVLQRIKETSPRDLSISTITQMEIEFGLQLNPERAKKINKIITHLLDNIHVLPFTHEDAHCAAAIRAALQRKGLNIGAYDVLLAGCALHRGLIFVTSNVKEFERVSGLQVENWRLT